METIPSYIDSDFKELVIQVWDLTHDRHHCNFLDGDFEAIKRASELGDMNPYSLRYPILGIPFENLPLYINRFIRKNDKNDKICSQIVKWRLRIGK